MGTDATEGVTVTDMLRDIQSSVSTEGMMEKTTYILDGQVVGYSETEAMIGHRSGWLYTACRWLYSSCWWHLK